jgi:hypothetical protein
MMIRTIVIGLSIALGPLTTAADSGPEISVQIGFANLQPPNMVARCILTGRVTNDSENNLEKIEIQVREQVKQVENIQAHSFRSFLAGFPTRCEDIIDKLRARTNICRWQSDTSTDCREFVKFTRMGGGPLQ